ncbi:MAG: prepilin-type N-terminal cleavage/methylation domain-containing protein [Bacillota bacterium]|nr:prepilin-type N-terminal cleavage/methylation domain-containing protein [Bacillota bacterium]
MKLFNEKGFSLVEVIVAITILGIVIVSISGLYTGSFASVFAAGNKNQALRIAQQQLEKIYGAAELHGSSSVLGAGKEGTLAELLAGELPVEIVGDCNSLLAETTADLIRICIDREYVLTDVEGYLVRIAVFYQNGDKKVTISSFVK